MFKGFRGLLAGAGAVISVFAVIAWAAGPSKTQKTEIVDATASPGASAVWFEEAQFGGRAMVLQALNPVLGQSATHKPGSIQVRDGSWRLCEKPRFQGRCLVVSGDHPDLAWNGALSQVASAQRVD